MMPLQIFEPRYLQMIEDSLDTEGRIVMGTVLHEHSAQLPGTPPVEPIAGKGEITKYDHTPDGRMTLLLAGLERVQIEEVESDRLYRKVITTPIVETKATDKEDLELRPQLFKAIENRAQVDLSVHEKIPLSILTDILAQCVQAPEDVMRGLFSEARVALRAQMALAAHEQFKTE